MDSKSKVDYPLAAVDELRLEVHTDMTLRADPAALGRPVTRS